MPDDTSERRGAGGGAASRAGTSRSGGRSHVPVTSVSPDAPQMQIAARNPQRAELVVAAAFVLGAIGFAGFGAAYWQNWSNFWLGITLSVGFAGLGYGMVIWGKYLMPRGPFSEERHRLAPTEEQKAAFMADFAGRGTVAVERRGFLVKILGVAGGIFGIVALFPLLRSLGPLPGKTLTQSHWYPGARVVDFTGRPIHVDDVEVGGFITVFPSTDVGGAYSQTMLVRPGPAGQFVPPPARFSPQRNTWGPDGYLAFSKVCTHAGCPVGLYQELTQQMLCPCHQSLFDVMNAATPVFGPAPRPLPQLPLMVDSNGYLRAQAGYSEPVGPGYWERGND